MSNALIRRTAKGSEYLVCRTCRSEQIERHLARKAQPGYVVKPRKRRSHCARGHAMTPENTYERPMRGPQCFQCMRMNKLKYDQRVRPGKGGKRSELITKASPTGIQASPSQIEQIKAIIKSGMTLYKAIDGIVTTQSYKNYAYHNPGVHKQLRHLSALNCQRMPHIISATAKVRSNSWLDLQALPLVEKVLPSIPEFMRNDIKQELLVELWSGELAPDQIAARAKKLLTQQYKSYDLLSKFGHLSLDVTPFDDSNETRIARISSEQGLWS